MPRGRPRKTKNAAFLAGAMRTGSPARAVVSPDTPPPSYGVEPPIALAEWRRILPWLVETRGITEAELTVAWVYCLTYSALICAERDILKGNDDSGTRQQRNSARRDLTKLAGELGITLASRMRVELTPESEPDNPMEALRNG
jgi:phage terminase small subunit